jgi:structure-specific endonuclease subunit SLX1
MEERAVYAEELDKEEDPFVAWCVIEPAPEDIVQATVCVDDPIYTNGSCYLLRPVNRRRYPNTTYIGFTVDPARRLRQHNGELVQGAKRTRGKRPWEMALLISGFECRQHARQLEWHWQHPTRSTKLRWPRYPGTYEEKLRVLDALLEQSPWNDLTLTENPFSKQ